MDHPASIVAPPARSWVLLAFSALTFGLIVAKAAGVEIDYELIILAATIAGLDTMRSLAVRAGAAVFNRRAKPPEGDA